MVNRFDKLYTSWIQAITLIVYSKSKPRFYIKKRLLFIGYFVIQIYKINFVDILFFLIDA